MGQQLSRRIYQRRFRIRCGVLMRLYLQRRRRRWNTTIVAGQQSLSRWMVEIVLFDLYTGCLKKHLALSTCCLLICYLDPIDQQPGHTKQSVCRDLFRVTRGGIPGSRHPTIVTPETRISHWFLGDRMCQLLSLPRLPHVCQCSSGLWLGWSIGR